MPGYYVEWAIDIDADNPRDAARQAWEHMRRKDSDACVFEVIEHDSDGDKVRVDLMEDEDEDEEVTDDQPKD